MSLINEVLRELGRRAPGWSDPLAHVQVVDTAATPRPQWGRTVLFIALVAVFTVVLLLLQQRRQVQGAETPAVHPALLAGAEAGEPPPAIGAPTSPLPQTSLSFLQLESRLHAPPASTAPVAAVRSAAPRPASPAAPAAKPASRARHRPAPRIEARRTSPPPPPARAIDERHELPQLREQALAAQAVGDYEEAEARLRSMLEVDPGSVFARGQLVALLIDQGRVHEAEEALRPGREDSPDSPTFRRLAAQLALRAGKPEEALAALRAAPPPELARHPEFHAVLAAAYQQLGRHAEAAQVYHRLTQWNADEGTWWVGYAISLEAIGRRDESLMAYLRARRLGGLHPSLLAYATTRSAVLREELGR